MEEIEIIAAGYSYTEAFIKNNIDAARKAGISMIISDNGGKTVECGNENGVNYRNNQSNRGYSYALNRGFELANSRYVLLCNDDIIFPEGFLSQLKSRIPVYETTDAGIVGFRIMENGRTGR